MNIAPSRSNSLSEIVVEWRSPEGGDAIFQYEVKWKHFDVTKNAIVYHLYGKTNYSYTITNLQPATTYDVQIGAINVQNFQVYSFRRLTSRNFSNYETTTTCKYLTY